MAYDEALAERVRKALERRRGITERKMFGGIAFMLHGNMCAGVIDQDLMVRVGPEGADDALAEPHARPMDFTGKPMKGMVYVGPRGIDSDPKLQAWCDRGWAFAKTLPKK